MHSRHCSDAAYTPRLPVLATPDFGRYWACVLCGFLCNASRCLSRKWCRFGSLDCSRSEADAGENASHCGRSLSLGGMAMESGVARLKCYPDMERRYSAVFKPVLVGVALLCLLVFGMGVVIASDTKDAEEPVRCHAGIYIVSLSDADLRSGTCVADFWVWFRWRDPDYNPLESLEVIDGVIDEKSGEVHKTLKDGQQYACQRIRATIRQKWDVHRFPLDTQRIVLLLEDAEVESDQVAFVPDETGSRVSPSVSVPGWNIGQFSIGTQAQVYDTNYGDTDLPDDASSEYSRIVVTLDLHRPGMGLFFKLFSGLFVAVGIALVSIAIRPTDLDPRFGLPVGAMFASIASQYVIASVLPDSADFTLADQLHVLAVIVIFLTLLESVASLFLTYADCQPLARRMDAATILVFTIGTVFVVFQLVTRALVRSS